MTATPPSNAGEGAPLVRTGDIVAGKYRIERVIGQGGMGVVVAARHLQLDELVALKFLRSHAIGDRDALARFTREARAAAKLKSEHVARVLDAGVGDDGTPYIAMEYLEGRTLGKVIEDVGRLDVATAAEYAIQACEGLSEAHSRGIVHRDIKPDNLFLVERAQSWRVVKVLDFGISKFAAAHPNETGNVSTQSMMGSPCYMSPEQLRSTATVDHRTDIWSLGATLFELLAGGTAYNAAQTLPQLITAILEDPAPRIVDIWPDVPIELSDVIAKCMAKEREQRFESAAELALALLPFAPKRCRANVERAMALARGSESASSRQSLSTAPPPPGGAEARPPSVPGGTLKSASSSKVTPEPGTLDTLAAPTVHTRAPRLGVRRGLLGAIAVAGGAIAVWALTRSTSQPAPPHAASAEPGPVLSTSADALPPQNGPAWALDGEVGAAVGAAVGAESSSAAATAPAPLAEAGAPALAATSAPSARPTHHTPAPAHSAAAPPPAASSSPGLDIRMQR